ncbi:MAG: Smr/MutS family protein [Desulforhopalus sp.]|nr:Smr/MutS family protein [Desulforhopalus sp.]
MTCHVCGNEMPAMGSSCPYCGAAMEEPTCAGSTVFIHKTVNLEVGRPVVEVALKRCRLALDEAIMNKVSIMTLIHGYGSSGKGGAIRAECRNLLDYFKEKGMISDYIAGEDFHKKSGRVKALLRRYAQLAKDRNLNQGNQGITLVILSFSFLFISWRFFVSTAIF